MSIFLAALCKRGEEDPLRAVDFAAYLPFEPVSCDQAKIGSASLLQFSFGAALDRPIKKSAAHAMVLQGYGRQDLEAALLDQIFTGSSICSDDFPEAFCCVAISDSCIAAYSSATGVDQVFVLETDAAIYLTNRHNLLGPFMEGVGLDKTSFKWMAGRTHIGSLGTYWKEVRRLRPGYKEQYWAESARSVAPGEVCFSPVSEEECASAIDSFAEDFSNIFASVAAEKRIWLSGGKDSRAILGVLDYSRILDSVSIVTGGELFSPDVMAASDLVAMVGASRRHTINRPSLVTAEVDLARRVAGDLAADFTGASLADLKGLNRSSLLVIGGHENGFKAKANTLSLDEYVSSRRYWVDNQDILKEQDRRALLEEFNESLREALSGVPVGRYSQVDLAMFRNRTFLPSVFNGSHVAGSEVHPFLDGRLFKLLCGVSSAALDAQFIHYLMMRKSAHPIETVAFAADRWPATLQSLAAQAGLPLRGKPMPPYTFNPAFPSQKSFGMYDWRLRMIELSRPFTNSYIQDNSSFFDFINQERMGRLMQAPVNELKFSEMYTILGLYKMALVHRFGVRALRFSDSSIIAAEVAETLSGTGARGSGVPVSENKSMEVLLKEKLGQYDACVVDMVKQLRAATTDGAAAYKQAFNDAVAWLFDSQADRQDFPARLQKLAQDSGYVELRESGEELGVFPDIESRTRIRIGMDVIMDSSADNSMLVAFTSNVAGLVPVGFKESPAGFYYVYVNVSRNADSVSLMVEFPEASVVPDGAQLSLKIMPWYSRSPIYIHASAERL